MANRRLKNLGIIIFLTGIPSALGPVYLGLVRDDIHAHSFVGDTGLQVITICGSITVSLGLYLFFLGRKTSRPQDGHPRGKLPETGRDLRR